MTEEKYLKERKNEIAGRRDGERGREGGREEREGREKGGKNGWEERGQMARLGLSGQLEVTVTRTCPVSDPGRFTP